MGEPPATGSAPGNGFPRGATATKAAPPRAAPPPPPTNYQRFDFRRVSDFPRPFAPEPLFPDPPLPTGGVPPFLNSCAMNSCAPVVTARPDWWRMAQASASSVPAAL